MGKTNEIKETNIGQGLINKECSQCNKLFTERDICEDNNWGVDFDTSNDVIIEDNKIKGYGYNLTIWIRLIYHDDCDLAAEHNKKDEEKKEPKEKTEWEKLGDKIKNAPTEIMENLAKSQKRAYEFMNSKEGKKFK